MSDCTEGNTAPLTAFGHGRRQFLEQTALATAGASVAAVLPPLLPAVGCAAPRAAVETAPTASPSECPEVKLPMQEVAGKVAFITGGSSGIGLGIARAFAEAGMKVVIGYRTPKHLEEALQYLKPAGDRVHAIRVDVTDRAGLEQAAAETVQVFGKVHVLVNNAGVVQHALLSQTTYDDWDWQLGVNLTGVFNGIHTFLPRLQAHGEGGQIITTSSVLGLFTGSRSGVYSASKYAVVGLMEALRAELAEANPNIGASVFCPGLVRSNVMDARRNRPRELAETGFTPDSAMQARERQMRQDPELAMDPLEAGRLVLRGMRHNDLYILTHPEYEGILRDRHEALLASIPREVPPTEARRAMARSLRHSIYATERERRRCLPARRPQGAK